MKNLFDKEAYAEVTSRIGKLSPDTKGLWGKMEVAQMMAHCKEAFKVPLSDYKYPRIFMGIMMGWMMKAKLYNESPWGKNLPTAPNFKITGARDFGTERKELNELIFEFHSAGASNVGKFPHPFFGKLTPEQWGKGMYKHLDHHLTQFGV